MAFKPLDSRQSENRAALPISIGSAANTTLDSLFAQEGTAVLNLGASSTASVYVGGISLAPTSYDTEALGGVNIFSASSLVASGLFYIPTGKRRINVSTTTTVYLAGQINYSVSGGATWGTNSYINARRVR
jgi:hypothetical protein